MARKYPTVAQALQGINKLARTGVKTAELGGDGGDQPFEQAFSNLAHAYLRDKAPSLLDHELGFQLLDRNQENTKAVGVFGFKVGSNMLYAPVFFLQGNLKGHELLYIKNQDMFVPMKENWLNYILNRKPNILGESVQRNTNQLGIQQPDLNRLSKSPWKYAAAVAPWCRDVLPKFAKTALTDVSAELDAWRKDLDLSTFCKQASLPMLDVLVRTMQKYPAVAQEIINHHGDLEFISASIKTAHARGHLLLEDPAPSRPRTLFGDLLDETRLHPIKSGALKIITMDTTEQTELPNGPTEEDAEKLLADGVLIKDERDDEDVSVPYNVQVEQKLFNPQESGIYYVLTKPGEFKKCMIVHNPHGPDSRHPFATLILLDGDGPKKWLNAHPTRIWCTSKIDEGLQPEEFKTIWDGLTDATNDNVGSEDSRKVLVGPRGDGTIPFLVKKELGDEKGGRAFEVDFSDRAEYEYEGSLLAPTHPRHEAYNPINNAWIGTYDKYRDGERVHFDTKDGTKVRSNGGDLYIPKGYKIIKLKLSEWEQRAYDRRNRKDSDDLLEDCCAPMDRSEETPIRLGNIIDAELSIMKKTAALDLRRAGNRIFINDKQAMSPVEALCSLVGVHGFREKVARFMLDEIKSGSHKTYRVKYAGPFGDPRLTEQGPSAPGFPEPNMGGGDNMMGFRGQTMGMQEQDIPVSGMSGQDNRAAYGQSPDNTQAPMDRTTIQNAMQSGQKEVFDTAMLGSMLKAVRDDTMIDRYLPKLVEGMDRLGRILFMFYWHGDKFADRYGKQDMPELEDSLRNAFEMMGDVILFLKQKTIEPYPEEDSVALNLDEPAAA